MKNAFLSLSILLASLAAKAEVVPAIGTMVSTFDVPRTIRVASDAEVVLVKGAPVRQNVEVLVQLVGESQSALSNYLNQWGLSTSSDDSGQNVKVAIAPRGGFASSNCSLSKINGSITNLNGVCVDKIIVTVPLNLEALLLNDGKTIVINGPRTQVPPGAAIRPIFLVSPEKIKFLIADLKEATFDSNQKEVLRKFVEREIQPTGAKVSVDQYLAITQVFNFDDMKVETLSALRPALVIEDIGSAIDRIVSSLTFDSSKEKARDIILGTHSSRF